MPHPQIFVRSNAPRRARMSRLRRSPRSSSWRARCRRAALYAAPAPIPPFSVTLYMLLPPPLHRSPHLAPSCSLSPRGPASPSLSILSAPEPRPARLPGLSGRPRGAAQIERANKRLEAARLAVQVPRPLRRSVGASAGIALFSATAVSECMHVFTVQGATTTLFSATCCQ
jgi:hypothetical protein